jgi:hypothetical protein
MIRRLLLPMLIIILVPVALAFAWLFATSTGVLSQQIPGMDAHNKSNITCVYFFARGFKNDVTISDSAACPRQITLKELDAQTH